jgi:hypothetical protein
VTTGALIVAKLTASDAVTALVGDRIFPNMAPDGVSSPRIVYSVVSDVPENSLDGEVGKRLRRLRLQVDCYAVRHDTAEQLAEAVDEVLGNLDSPSLSGWRENSIDMYDDIAKLHRVLQEYTVWR